jgi:hypothetical protein
MNLISIEELKKVQRVDVNNEPVFIFLLRDGMASFSFYFLMLNLHFS